MNIYIIYDLFLGNVRLKCWQKNLYDLLIENDVEKYMFVKQMDLCLLIEKTSDI